MSKSSNSPEKIFSKTIVLKKTIVFEYCISFLKNTIVFRFLKVQSFSRNETIVLKKYRFFRSFLKTITDPNNTIVIQGHISTAGLPIKDETVGGNFENTKNIYIYIYI